MDGCIFRKTTGLKSPGCSKGLWTTNSKILMKMKKATDGLRKQSVQNVDK